jgi:4'-phosphopantetheinyl transferase
MTPIEREPPMEAGYDLAIARCTVAAGLSFACATVSDQLDQDEQVIYRGLTDPADRRCYAAARGLLRIELSQHLALPPQDWEYVPKPGGPTEIRTPLGRLDNLRFSLSHTRGLVACAVADASSGPYREVGIDVEWVRPMPGMDKLARLHFAPAEVAAMRALPTAQQGKRFFSLWTLRQAWAKAHCGPHDTPHPPLEERAVFTFDESGHLPQATFAAGLQEASSRWRFWLHALDEDHVLSVAAREREMLD